jgi:competence protein ComEC
MSRGAQAETGPLPPPHHALPRFSQPQVWRAILTAMVAWPVAWLCIGASPLTSGGVSMAFLLLAGLAAWIWWRGGGVLSTAVFVSALTSGAVAGSSYLYLDGWHRSPWPQLIDSREHIRITFEFTAPPRVITSAAFAEVQQRSVSGPARVKSLEVAGEHWEISSPVWITAPSRGPPIQRGDVVLAEARASPADLRRGVAARLDVLTIESVTSTRSPRAAVDGWFDRALASGSVDSSALVRGMAIGDDSALSADTREQIERVGLSHLTAVSGANLAIVVAAVLASGRAIGMSRKALLLPALLAMIGYAGLVGPEPSVLRASAMAVVMLAALLVGGGAGLSALGSAVTVLLVWQPALSASQGFALSTAATAGLVLAAPTSRRLLRHVTDNSPRLLAPVAAVGITAVTTATAASMATAPLLAAYGNGVSWMSVLANSAVAALVPFITVGGLVAAASATVVPDICGWLAAGPLLGARWILIVAQVSDSVRLGRTDLPAGWAGFTVVVAGAVVGWALPPRWRGQLAALAAVVVATSVLLSALPHTRGGAPHEWAVAFCDVGQGDSALVRTGMRSAVVIDAGPQPQSLDDCLRRHRVDTVDAVVLSHYHLDHVAGLAQVLDSKPNDAARPALVVSPVAEPADIASEIRRTATRAGITPRVAHPGLRLGYGWLSLEVWAPEEVINAGSRANNSSVVLRAVVVPPDRGQVSVLFTGDIEPDAQTRVMRRAADPQVDVVKVPHHGSANQHPQFAHWVRAEVAVVSCGKDNTYGHPAPNTVRAWTASGATVARTDTDGDIYLWRDDSSRLRVAVR